MLEESKQGDVIASGSGAGDGQGQPWTMGTRKASLRRGPLSGDLRDEEEQPLMHISEQMTHQVGASWAKALGCDGPYGSSGDEAGSSTW